MIRFVASLVFVVGISCANKTEIKMAPALEGQDAGGGGTDGNWEVGESQNVQEFVIQHSSTRELDLIFVLDNSSGTDPFRQKLQQQFPRLIEALRDSTSNPPLPDLRIAIVTSDVGTGASGLCKPAYGDQGKFQMPNAEKCGVSPGATFLEYKNGKNLNFASGQDIAQIFGCLATGVSSEGCNLEQPLQALNFSMFLIDPETKQTQAQEFIRRNATLGIVVLANEDDCSMPVDSLLAEESSIAATEFYSLRCATRGHQCGDSNMVYPTTAPFEADFYTCKAREDTCPPGETGRNPTSCSPLESVKGLADKLKSVKTISIDGQVTTDIQKFLVAGLIGWPRKDQTSATYKIDLAPAFVNNSKGYLFDYWPVCYDPDHPLPENLSDDNDVSIAHAWGAYGGLRIKAFLDEFPKDSALTFSICERDYSEAMGNIGQALAHKLSNVCVPLSLFDADPNRVGFQPSCQVFDLLPMSESAGSVEMRTGPTISHCDVALGKKPCWKLATDLKRCPEMKSPGGNTILSQLLVVERLEPVPPNSRTVLRCQTLP
jgi:hypothetical protein